MISGFCCSFHFFYVKGFNVCNEVARVCYWVGLLKKKKIGCQKFFIAEETYFVSSAIRYSCLSPWNTVYTVQWPAYIQFSVQFSHLPGASKHTHVMRMCRSYVIQARPIRLGEDPKSRRNHREDMDTSEGVCECCIAGMEVSIVMHEERMATLKLYSKASEKLNLLRVFPTDS